MTAVGGPERVYRQGDYRIRVKVWPAGGGRWTAEWYVTPDPQAPPNESPGRWLPGEEHETQDGAFEAAHAAAEKWLSTHT